MCFLNCRFNSFDETTPAGHHPDETFRLSGIPGLADLTGLNFRKTWDPNTWVGVASSWMEQMTVLLHLSGVCRFLVTAVTVFIFACCATVLRVTPVYGQGIESLRGLSGVMIKVDLAEEVKKDGLTQSQVTADAELALQQGNIPVLSHEKWQHTIGRPYLYVRIESAKIQDNWKFYTYSIQLHLFQDVTLSRNNQPDRLSASTWNSSIIGHGYLGDIRVHVKEAIDRFASDYSAANPQ